uniref:lipoprotein LpqS n=1 Tax=Klebsiella pneumoniae TaxID=573 RepID=UPI000C1F03DB
HPNHPLTTSVGSEFVINTDHGHLVENSMPPCPERLATAVLPRSATPVLLPDVVAAAPGMTAALTDPVAPAARGPPAAQGSVRTGQDLLTRFCLARR